MKKKESHVSSLRLRRTRRPAGLLVLVLALLGSHAALAQRKPVGSQAAGSNPAKSGMMMMPSIAPLFIEGGGFSSTLHLVNETTTVIRAKVDIYSLQGVRVAGRTLPVAANGLEMVSIRDVLSAGAANLDIGSVRITSDPEGDGLAAAIAFTHLGRNENYFEEEVPMPTMEGSTVLRGVADDGETAIVAISSLSSEIQNLGLSCLLEGEAPRSRVVELAPNQTLLARPCVAEMNNPIITGADIERESRTIHDARRTATAAAISITTDGMPGELAAYGIVPHRARGDQFFTAVNFTDPKLKRSSGFVYAGVPVGASEFMSEGDYKPEVAVANFGPKTASITIESAVTIGGKPDKQLLGSVSLGVGEVKTIPLSGMHQTPDLRASVMIKTNVAPGDVITKLLSRGESRLRAVELLDKEISNGENGGGHPWSIAAGNTSILLLFNHDAKEQWFNVRLGGGPGKEPWMKRYKLASMETLGININQLIARQELDDKDHRLLVQGQTGEVGWQADGSGAAGRVLQANPMMGMARNFSCSNYYTECGVSDSPNPSSMDLGSAANMTGSNQWNLYHNAPSNSCSCSSTAYANLALNYGWSSANSSVASITSGNNASSSQWQGAGTASTSASFSETGPYGLMCQAPSAPVKVSPVPSYLTVSVGDRVLHNGDIASYPDGQPINSHACLGYSRVYTYLINGNDSKPFTQTGTTVTETNATTSSNPSTSKLQTPVSAGTNQGYFYDGQLHCTTGPPGPPTGTYIRGNQQLDVIVGSKT